MLIWQKFNTTLSKHRKHQTGLDWNFKNFSRKKAELLHLILFHNTLIFKELNTTCQISTFKHAYLEHRVKKKLTLQKNTNTL